MIVVTGATGNVGRSLVSQLVAEGQPVRGLTRDPDRAALPAGAEAVRADFADPAALAALFAGATGLFINLSAVGEHTPAVLAAAIPAGVRRVVMLSSGAVDDDPDETNPLVAHHVVPERAVMASGAQWTLLRPNGFAVNSFQWAPQIRAGDVVRAPFAGARSAPIHEADIAAVAVRALVDDGHHTAIYRLTGPEAFSNAEQVGIIGAALGRDLRYEEIPREQVRPELFPHVPPGLLDTVLDALAAAAAEEPEVSTAVAEVTGRPALTFARWAADHAAAFTRPAA
ncbi:NAD(P)H-binding protein [Streptomyces sp. 71268]|uniref:SDR family oxidoreductase n=1 Tax=Streptomyces sp. 71268 TaxID=3002640 RepID=UPI0023F893FC|nr:NAD(P)H-binding protein [Streptomyces sp. 71268]WEV28387.1 NAD(P)H-binding protein [Streptomyces sp. 71268]